MSYDPKTDPVMVEMFARARRDGLWFQCAYQDIWLSPDELEAYHKRGTFRWGPVNWMLRSPSEHVANMLADIRRREAELAEFRLRAKL